MVYWWHRHLRRLFRFRMLTAEVVAGPKNRPSANGERGEPAAAPPRRAEMIEITLSNGCRLPVDQQIDVRTLRRTVGVVLPVISSSGPLWHAGTS